MRSHEAIQSAIAGQTVEHAKSLHLATVTVNKWQEPTGDFTDSGAFNPLDRIETMTKTALDLKSPSPYSMIHYLNEAFGFLCLKMPEGEATELTKDLMKSVEEFGQWMQEVSKDLIDGKIDAAEAKRIRIKGMKAVRAILTFIGEAEESAGKADR
jgi:hypothetical protein